MPWRERLAAWLPLRQRDLHKEYGETTLATAGADVALVAAVLALTGFGIVMVFSAGAIYAAKTYGDKGDT